MSRRPVGVVDVVYAAESDVARRSELAAADGFAHVDVAVEIAPSSLALPVGCPTAFPRPVPGWCATPAPARGDGMWERCVRWFRAAPGALLEPWAGGVVHSTDTVRAMLDEVPGLRLLVDTGHVADWGGDPLELLAWADHVQLRQGAPGRTQLHVDDPAGVVDLAAVLGRLDAIGYPGRCSIEYFDLPAHGWALADPRGWALDLARHVGALP
ncbi:MAG: sugar phosphate isomerase/epimerase [Actinobacteria bacterium]|nr:sugar phosphate isomerase/epimerase [Actinomycetota bacterium]